MEVDFTVVSEAIEVDAVVSAVFETVVNGRVVDTVVDGIVLVDTVVSCVDELTVVSLAGLALDDCVVSGEFEVVEYDVSTDFVVASEVSEFFGCVVVSEDLVVDDSVVSCGLVVSAMVVS